MPGKMMRNSFHVKAAASMDACESGLSVECVSVNSVGTEGRAGLSVGARPCVFVCLYVCLGMLYVYACSQQCKEKYW